MSDAGDKPSATPDTEAGTDAPEADPADPAEAISRAATVAAAWIPRSTPVAVVGAGSVFGSRESPSASGMADEGSEAIDGPEPAATIGPPESSARDHAEDVPAEDIQLESVEDRSRIELDSADDRPEDDDDIDAVNPAAGPASTAPPAPQSTRADPPAPGGSASTASAAALPAGAKAEARPQARVEAAATVRSPGPAPVLLLVLTGIAVLILIVIIVGVLYMLDIL